MNLVSTFYNPVLTLFFTFTPYSCYLEAFLDELYYCTDILRRFNRFSNILVKNIYI